MRHLVFTVLIYLLAAPAMALELALPVACELGKTCWVQQYADHDAGPGAVDYACGVASYNGHDGTDFRVLHTGVRTDVLAAAAGTVKAVRDGVEDVLVRGAAELAAVKGVECGNGLVIDHGEGWETQYCHMRKDSVTVKPGAVVTAGSVLGQIGFSGEAAFPHLHLSVRQEKRKIDPFSSDDVMDCKTVDRSLWNASAQAALAYTGTDVLLLEWSHAPLEARALEDGSFQSAEPSPDAPAIVVNAIAINMAKGDVVSLMIRVPGQEPAVNRVVMENNRALQRLFVGKKRKGAWPPGTYGGTFEIRRGDTVMLTRQIAFSMP